jgi:transposase-like protein
MDTDAPDFLPPHCPNDRCHYHRLDRPGWRFVRIGFYTRRLAPRRIQRFRCRHCRRRFSTQTFSTTYWLKRPLLAELFGRLVGCGGYRQIARALGCSPNLVLGQTARLGRHCQLFHHQRLPAVREPLSLDTFVGFEYSQYAPTGFHVAVGKSHFFYGFTVSELRRSGAMREDQKRRRGELERRHGRSDPRATEKDVATLLATLCPRPQPLELHTDEHHDYPRALRRVPHLAVAHHTISSRAARTPRNPLFPINLLDLLIRHSGANHKRESIAFSKRRQSAAARISIFAVWRNYQKSFSERQRDATPAMKLGVESRRWSTEEILAARLFVTRVGLPAPWLRQYRGTITTRYLARNRVHALRYAA